MQHGQRIAAFVTVGNDVVNGFIVVTRGPSIGLPISQVCHGFFIEGRDLLYGRAKAGALVQ